MDIVVTGRHAQVTDRFREHLEEKLAKVPQLLPKVSRVDVVVTHEATKNDSECVEITCHAKGPMIRAEACHTDKYAALDTALDKLYERLRRAGDRRRVSRGRRTPDRSPGPPVAPRPRTSSWTCRPTSPTGRPPTAPRTGSATRRSRCARRCTPARR